MAEASRRRILVRRLDLVGFVIERFIVMSRAEHVPRLAKPVHVNVAGAAGRIGYSLVFRIAAGGLFGPDQPVALSLLELPGLVTGSKPAHRS